MDADTRLVWMDLEMTGLDPERCAIIEIAAVVTGADLAPIAEVEHVIWQPESVLAQMEPYVREMHSNSGLLVRVRQSSTSLKQAEDEVLKLITAHCGFREAFLAGNSIHQDRRFLNRYMPAVERLLHYRQLDVSSLKILAHAWFSPSLKFEKPNQTHTARDDIRLSIAELQFYRERMLRGALAREA